MGKQHFAVYGYRFDGTFPWDKMYREDEYNDGLVDKLMEYDCLDVKRGQFALFQEPRAHKYVIAGIVQAFTGEHGKFEPTVLEKPDDARVQAMEDIIDEEFPSELVQRKTDSPEHIVFTHSY